MATTKPQTPPSKPSTTKRAPTKLDHAATVLAGQAGRQMQEQLNQAHRKAVQNAKAGSKVPPSK
ncbi:hypothetical protein FN976_26155 [Caenimonas sedimenti]|uniref:Uncharacterized protein n=1 Tax=Caenimonas sedimenti TaxID=2596921 RepID=A0A562ZGC0_9BURK|nr:hypothetical protein [Caenimonas sedimenti]TWO67018.1 hypothetical protein FN976_26155 [Caenimonas sedimenti]